MNDKIGFIGLGLIGGSIAKAIRAVNPNVDMIAYDIDSSAILQAVSEGVISRIATAIDDQFADRDLIFLCAPVSSNDENLLTLKTHLSKDAILTDVGSVKADIHAHIAQAGLNAQFIGGHPMAGSERTGYRNSKEKLLENAYYILTPTNEVSVAKVHAMQQLVESIGAIPLIMPSDEHDFCTAGVSHVPHIISALLVHLVRGNDDANGTMKMIAAGGFKDITRISSSSATMWEHICMTNRKHILTLLDQYLQDLQAIRDKIDAGDATAIHHFFEQARIYRDSFAEAGSGPIKKSYVLHIDIPDKTGALASIVSLLAGQKISIKNIGITHNREDESGSLRLELYEETDIPKAKSLLEHAGFNVSATI
ncbi:MAG: prephenate dehydrogenase [Lachnospiraceae bacterium]|nr:prephenate dehydrogenase [Lachnospiraceae bacterium]